MTPDEMEARITKLENALAALELAFQALTGETKELEAEYDVGASAFEKYEDVA